MKKHQKISFSLLFTLFISAINIIDFALSGFLFNTFALETGRIVGNFEYWRLFSFPFFFGSVESTFLFVIMFLFISPHVENFLSTKLYPLFLFLVSFVLGSITTMIFADSGVVLGGMEGISFFVFVLYLLLLFKSKVIAEKYPALVISSAAVFFWSIFKYFTAVNYGFFSILPALAISVLGIIVACLIYLQINRLIKNRIRKAKMSMKPMRTMRMPTYEEISMAIHANTDFKRFINKSLKNNQHVVSPKIGENPVENEEQLNIILDKIIIDGKDSLSKEEIIFLEEYSRSL